VNLDKRQAHNGTAEAFKTSEVKTINVEVAIGGYYSSAM